MKPKTNPFLRPALLAAAVFAFAGAASQAIAATEYRWNGNTDTAITDWTTAANWASPGIGANPGTGGTQTYDARLNVYNGANSKLIYSAAQGTTVYKNSGGKGLVISQAGGNAGSMEIIGGSFSTLGSADVDVIGNAQTGTLTISGGSFIGSANATTSGTTGGTVVGLNSSSGTSTLTVKGTGSATLANLQLAGATATVNLDGGTLTVKKIVDIDNLGTTGNSNTTFNFNGGTLVAGASDTAFMTGLTQAYVLSGGAKIDTVDKNITIGQALLAPVSGTSGGLTKYGTGTLTLSNTNTYTGATTLNGGILNVTGSTASGSAVSVGGGSATGAPKLAGSGTINGTVTVKSAGGGAAGILNAGDATAVNKVGTISMGSSLTFESGSIFEWDLNANKDTNGLDNDLGTTADNGVAGTDFDKVNVAGNLTIASDAVFKVIQNSGVVFTDPFWTQNQTWSNIFNVTGTTIGNWSNAAVSVYNTGGTLQDVSTYGSFTISGTSLTWTAVPEPTSALAGLLITAGLLRRRRA